MPSELPPSSENQKEKKKKKFLRKSNIIPAVLITSPQPSLFKNSKKRKKGLSHSCLPLSRSPHSCLHHHHHPHPHSHHHHLHQHHSGTRENSDCGGRCEDAASVVVACGSCGRCQGPHEHGSMSYWPLACSCHAVRVARAKGGAVP